MASNKLFSTPLDFNATLIGAISHAMPKAESDLSMYRKSLEPACKELEERFQLFRSNADTSVSMDDSMSMTSASTSKCTISRFLNDLPGHFAGLRRKEILERARELVLADYHNTMIAVGDASEDELSTAGDIGDPQALLDQSGSFAMQKLKFDSCQVRCTVCIVVVVSQSLLVLMVLELGTSIYKFSTQAFANCTFRLD